MGRGGGGSYWRYEPESHHIVYTTHCHNLFFKTVKFHKNNLDGIQNRKQCSLNNQGEITQKVCKLELSFLYVTHRHDLFYITVKCHDNIQRVFKLQSGHEIASETIKGEYFRKYESQSCQSCTQHIAMTCST